MQDAQAFWRDWEANGPMVPGLDPMEAVDRLKKFQQMFEVRHLQAGTALLPCCWRNRQLGCRAERQAARKELYLMQSLMRAVPSLLTW